MKVVLSSDHAGFEYKSVLVEMLKEEGYSIHDLGAYSEIAEDDYPDYAAKVAESIQNKEAERGILICGSAVGVSVTANKFKGIRAAVCHDTYSAHQSVEHDDANVLCIGQRVVGIDLVKDIIRAFLNARFSDEPRHRRRLAKIAAIEDINMKENEKHS